MNTISKLAAVFVLVSVTLGVAAQAPASDDPANGFYERTRKTTAFSAAGEHDKAAAMASELLVEAESWKTNWNYGNAIHAANLVLGRAALKRGEIENARKFLLAAGRTPGSPQLNSFGPDMLFASEMLKAGEREAVLRYFDLCSAFWIKKHSKLDGWRASIERDETPEFGANLRYFF